MRDSLARVYAGEVGVKDGLQVGIQQFDQLLATQAEKLKSATK